jgi:protein TonB
MSQKISKLVSKKFNTDVASEHGITGLQKITTQFTVDKNGNITNIKIRGPHPALEREANRVINKIPSMKPGYQQDKPVGVIYNLPIKFMVRD